MRPGILTFGNNKFGKTALFFLYITESPCARTIFQSFTKFEGDPICVFGKHLLSNGVRKRVAGGGMLGYESLLSSGEGIKRISSVLADVGDARQI